MCSLVDFFVADKLPKKNTNGKKIGRKRVKSFEQKIQKVRSESGKEMDTFW